MKRSIFIRVCSALFAVALLFSCVNLDVNATTINELEQQKKQAEKERNMLQSEANGLNATYNDVKSQYNSLKSEVDLTNKKVENTTEELSNLSRTLSETKIKQAEIEEMMKVHIKYMYENSNKSIIAMFIESGSISEFIDRVEYMSIIIKYDKELIEKYKQVQNDVAIQSASLSEKRIELESESNKLNAKKSELTDLVSKAGGELADKKSEVNAAQKEVDSYDKKIKEMKAYEARLEAQNAAQQIAEQKRIKEEAGGEDTSGAITGYSEADLRLLASIIEAEAEGESYRGKLAVGSVVMNRVFSSKFPNTISGVVYQNNQFSPVKSGRLQIILDGSHDGRSSMNDSYSAAREVLGGYREVDKLFFWTVSLARERGIINDSGIIIGNHYFY